MHTKKHMSTQKAWGLEGRGREGKECVGSYDVGQERVKLSSNLCHPWSKKNGRPAKAERVGALGFGVPFTCLL